MTVLPDDPILLDQGAAEDGLNLAPRLSAALDVMRHKATRTPTTVAIYGDWGTGKTSAMRWLWDRLAAWAGQSDHQGHAVVETVWFEPWKYHTREDVWRGLIAEVILHCFAVRTMTRENLVDRLRQAAKHFGRFLGRAFLDALSHVEIEASAGAPGKAGVTVSGELFREVYEEYGRASHPEKAYLNEFESTFRQWVADFFPQTPAGDKPSRRLALFMDDLDRCLPNVTLEVLEAMKLYLNVPGLLFIVGLDRAVVDAVVYTHYREHGLPEQKSRQYLNKMFQVEIDVAPTEVQVQGFLQTQIDKLDELTSGYWGRQLGAVCGDANVPAGELIQTMIEHLAGGVPREIKRLLNGTLMRADAAARAAELGGTEGLRFAQGAQIFLVQRFLERNLEGTAGLLLRKDAQDFFEAWSEFVRKYPDFKSPLEERPARPARPGGREESEDGETQQGEDEFQVLLEKLPRYAEGGFIEVWKYPELWDLMRIPFSSRVATVTAGAPEPEPPRVVERRAEAAGALPKPPAGIAALPKVLVNAVARAVGKRPGRLTDADLNEVRALDLEHSGITDLSPLARLTNLQTLLLTGTQVTDAGLAHLAGLTNLQQLGLDGTQVTDAGLEHLTGLANLQRLSLDGTQVTDAGLAHLAGLKNLQRLWLAGTPVTDAGLEHLAGLTNLHFLSLNGTQVTDAGLEHLTGLKNLGSLRLNHTQVTDAGLEYLTGLKNLQELWLGSTQVTDAGLAHLAGLKNLQMLSLTLTRVTDAGLEHLTGLANLQWLWLSGTQVTDAGLEYLAGLKNLQWLWLADTQVTDAGLEHLTGLKNLKGLAGPHTGHRREARTPGGAEESASPLA